MKFILLGIKLALLEMLRQNALANQDLVSSHLPDVDNHNGVCGHWNVGECRSDNPHMKTIDVDARLLLTPHSLTGYVVLVGSPALGGRICEDSVCKWGRLKQNSLCQVLIC